MKTLMLASVLMSASAFASDCLSLNLRWNSHPDHACPELTQLCLVNGEKGDATVSFADRSESVLKFDGYHIMNQSDVGQILYNSYTIKSSGMYLDLEFNNDGSWPATRTPGYASVNVYTGVQERSGVYSSQICDYSIAE
jgi:hypothetical protein